MPPLSPSYLSRFGGIGRLYGTAALRKLAKAHVCVVGVGGVGSWSVEALVRSGIGEITMIDLDEICINNTNRQLHTLEQTIGQQKVDALATRMLAINPELKVHAVADFFTPLTLDELWAPSFDFVIDAIDHVPHKALLLATCVARGTPVVTCGGAGGRQDASQVRIDDLSRTGSDGLLRQVRRVLRKEFDFAPKGLWHIPCVFSREPATYPQADGSVCQSPDQAGNLRLDCASGFGTATFITGTFGFMAAGLVTSALAKES